ncbi:MAG: abscisic acid-deficient protein Aba4 family protein [Alphaproteobacteria bacterium]
MFSTNLESWFSHAGLIAMIGWMILIFGPRRWPLLSAFPAYVFPAILSLGYAILILRHFGIAQGGFSTLADVALLFSNDHLLLAGWVHYLAFDLFIGAWIARQSDDVGISRVVQATILVTTFMLGPFGLLLFLIVCNARNLLLDIHYPMTQGALR